MAARKFILFAPDPAPDRPAAGDADTLWHIGVSHGTVAEVHEVLVPAGATAEAIHAALSALGRRREPVILALPSEQCLCAPVSTTGLQTRGRRAAMTYRLEEQLPVSAEEVTADFFPSVNETALGICAENDALWPLIEALQAHGVGVECISPAALLALQGQAVNVPRECGAFLWGREEQLELFMLQDGRLNGWYTIPSDIHQVLIYLKLGARAGAAPLQLCANDVPAHVLEPLLKLNGTRLIRSGDDSILNAATRTGAAVLSGKLAPWIELRRGLLSEARRSDRIAKSYVPVAASILVLVTCLSVAMLWRAQRYQSVVAEHERVQRDLFQRALPHQQVPTDIPSRLRSEERRFRAGSGVRHPPRGAETTSPVATIPVLVLLRDALGGLPPSVPFRLLEIRLDEDHLTIEGQARALAEVSVLAEALRGQAGLAIDGPKTQQLSGEGVNFTITGTARSLSASPPGRNEP